MNIHSKLLKKCFLDFNLLLPHSDTMTVVTNHKEFCLLSQRILEMLNFIPILDNLNNIAISILKLQRNSGGKMPT